MRSRGLRLARGTHIVAFLEKCVVFVSQHHVCIGFIHQSGGCRVVPLADSQATHNIIILVAGGVEAMNLGDTVHCQGLGLIIVIIRLICVGDTEVG